MYSLVRPPCLLFVAMIAAVVALAACSTPRAIAPRNEQSMATAGIAGAKDISSEIDAVIQRHGIPGMAAVVLKGDQIIAAGAAGVRKRGSNILVTLDDRFEIASAAKAMTATVVARCVEQGRLTWDTSVADLFASNGTPIDAAWRNVTVRQLLEHRAGLKDHAISFLRSVRRTNESPLLQRRNYVRKILARPPDFAPGQQFSYDNTDYIMLGAALEQLIGHSWPELLHDELFHPLGLASAGLGPPGMSGTIDQPWGHGGWRFKGLPVFPGNHAFDPADVQADFPLAAAPSGFVHVSLRDWARFAVVHLRGDSANPQRAVTLLAAESFDLLHTPETPNGSYAGGWFVGTRPWAKGPRSADRGKVLFHAGDNGRWTSAIYLAPEIDSAILVVCNQGSMAAGVDQMAGRLVSAVTAHRVVP